MSRIKQFLTKSTFEYALILAAVACSTIGLLLSLLMITQQAQRQWDSEAKCRTACLPNGFHHTYGKQCFCNASVVIRPVVEDQ